jgi:ribosome biogenesis GTPase
MTIDPDLSALGWSTELELARRDHPAHLQPARVACHRGAAIDLLTPRGARVALPAPDLAVGDWVLVPDHPDDPVPIEVVLPRRTELVRQAAGRSTRAQTIAANLDTVFVVTAMDDDFSPRRLERYLVAVAAGGAEAVVVLNKSDLALGREGRFVRQVPDSVPVLTVSALLDLGLDELAAYARPGHTVGFVGSSGVGKTSLLNALLGDETGAVGPVRASDGRGQHTTTRRELHRLPGGGLLLDTPGMRELALWSDAGIDDVFADIVALAEGCRFRDCSHATEPGCAVVAAVHDGELAEERLASFLKLRHEAERQALRRDTAAHRAERKRFAKVVKEAKRVGLRKR